LAAHYQWAFRSQLAFILAKHPKYAWGGAGDPEKGLDCSGYLFLAAKWAGIPGITRTTSAKMAEGLGGWTSREITVRQAKECDLVFWTFRKHRPNGHVGAFLNDGNGRRSVTHAGTRNGVVLEALEGQLLERMTRVRKLTIGE
jgi:cell wall-associated NlpC family hydrolase